METREYLSIREAAQLLSCCELTLRRRVQAGELTAYHLSQKNKLWFRASDIEAAKQPVRVSQ
jgi:excisionase family DNA binding protein